jgi:hypothetical protein
MRKKINWVKAWFFLRDKFESMLNDKNAIIKPAGNWATKIIVWVEKIVYEFDWEKYILITYIKKTEYDKIEYKILNIIKYHKWKNNWYKRMSPNKHINNEINNIT